MVTRHEIKAKNDHNIFSPDLVPSPSISSVKYFSVVHRTLHPNTNTSSYYQQLTSPPQTHPISSASYHLTSKPAGPLPPPPPPSPLQCPCTANLVRERTTAFLIAKLLTFILTISTVSPRLVTLVRLNDVMKIVWSP